jgi:hypothetical protein
VLYHLYGTAEIKKVDTRSIPFDFNLIQQMTSPDFLQSYETELNNFIDSLFAEQTEGKLYSHSKFIIF